MLNFLFLLYPNPKPISNQKMNLWTYNTFFLLTKFPLESFFSAVMLLFEGVSAFIGENLRVTHERVVGVRSRNGHNGQYALFS